MQTIARCLATALILAPQLAAAGSDAAAKASDTRFYATAMGLFVNADDARRSRNGNGGYLAAGKQFAGGLAVELGVAAVGFDSDFDFVPGAIERAEDTGEAWDSLGLRLGFAYLSNPGNALSFGVIAGLSSITNERADCGRAGVVPNCPEDSSTDIAYDVGLTARQRLSKHGLQLRVDLSYQYTGYSRPAEVDGQGETLAEIEDFGEWSVGLGLQYPFGSNDAPTLPEPAQPARSASASSRSRGVIEYDPLAELPAVAPAPTVAPPPLPVAPRSTPQPRSVPIVPPARPLPVPPPVPVVPSAPAPSLPTPPPPAAPPRLPVPPPAVLPTPRRLSPADPLDVDGDRVRDDRDVCPNTPPQVRVDAKGCAFDADIDGVPDELDRCPGSALYIEVDASGCPADADSDGLSDQSDQCPNTAAGSGVNAAGCAATALVDGVFTLDGVSFAPNSVEPTNAAKRQLQDVVAELKAVMQRHPEMTLEVAGHTDNSGDFEDNLTLSKRRAAAVAQYLVGLGLQGRRVLPLGFGDERPIADNRTAAGRQTNRRVELRLVSR